MSKAGVVSDSILRQIYHWRGLSRLELGEQRFQRRLVGPHERVCVWSGLQRVEQPRRSGVCRWQMGTQDDRWVELTQRLQRRAEGIPVDRLLTQGLSTVAQSR